MNGIDLLTIICLAGFLGMGIHKGLLKSISSLTALLLGIVLAKRYAPLGSSLMESLKLPDSHGILGYVLIFIIFYLAIRIVFVFVQKLSRATGLSVIDRTLGGILGLIKGTLIAVIIITIMQLSLPPESVVIKESQAVPYSNRIVSSAGALVPQKIYAQLKGT